MKLTRCRDTSPNIVFQRSLDRAGWLLCSLAIQRIALSSMRASELAVAALTDEKDCRVRIPSSPSSMLSCCTLRTSPANGPAVPRVEAGSGDQRLHGVPHARRRFCSAEPTTRIAAGAYTCWAPSAHSRSRPRVARTARRYRCRVRTDPEVMWVPVRRLTTVQVPFLGGRWCAPLTARAELATSQKNSRRGGVACRYNARCRRLRLVRPGMVLPSLQSARTLTKGTDSRISRRPSTCLEATDTSTRKS